MKWQLGGTGWPVGQWLIPASTILNGAAGPDGKITVKWNEITLPMPIPINAIALDNEAAALMLEWYPDQHYRLHFGPNVAR